MKQVYDWKDAMPKETENFHDRVCEALHSLPEERRNYRVSKKRYLPIIALAVLLISSVTAFAAMKWNDRAADNFGNNKKLQEKLTEEGYSSQNIQSVTDNGITITLEQTIQDENIIYMLFKVTSDDKKLTENNVMSYEMKASNGQDFYTSTSAGFVDELTQPDINNSREYEIWMQKNTAYDFKGAILNCNFNALQQSDGKAGSIKDLVNGQWNFSVDLSVNDSATIDLNKTLSVDGCDIVIHKIKLSPLSYTIYFDGDDVKELQKANNINIDELDITYPLIISGLEYKDATVIREDAGLMSEGINDKSGEYVITGRFSKVIDMTQIQTIILGDKTSISME